MTPCTGATAGPRRGGCNAGIHFWFAIRDVREKDLAIGAYVVAHAARPLHRWRPD